jgi:hypothetical protein
VDDRCVICGSQDSLWFTYPIPGYGTAGHKLCLEHRTMMEERPEEFLKLLASSLSKKRRRK